MPRRYNYYGEEPYNPGNELATGLSKGFERGIELVMAEKARKKQRGSEIDEELAMKGYKPAEEGVEYTPDTPSIELYGKKYVKPYTPTEIEDRAYEKEKRQLDLDIARKKSSDPDITSMIEAIQKLDGGNNINKKDLTLTYTGAGGAKVSFKPFGTTTQDKMSFAQEQDAIKQKEIEKRDEMASNMVIDAAKSTLDNIRAVKNGMQYFGVRGYVPAIAGEKKVWEANLNRLLSQRILDVMQSMKQASRTGATGFGQLSEKELKVLQDASTTLKPTVPAEYAKSVLDEMEAKMNKIIFDRGRQAEPTQGEPMQQPMPEQGDAGQQDGGITEEDIQYTMQQHPEYSREQILQMLGR